MRRLEAQQIVNKGSVGAVATDLANKILHVNKRARELFGWTDGRWGEGEEFFSVIEAKDVFGNRLRGDAFPFHQMVARGEAPHGFELMVRAGEGREARVAVSVVVLHGAEAKGDRVVYFLRPVLRRRRADEAIERILAGAAIHELVANDPPSRPEAELTARQTQVLRLVADGLGNEEIAEALGISVYTVRTHLRGAFRKLSVHNRIQAVKKAFQGNVL